MTSSPEFGGLKILKDAVWVHVPAPNKDEGFVVEACGVLAREKINLPFLTCGRRSPYPWLAFVVEAGYGDVAMKLMKTFGKEPPSKGIKVAILSIFPHRSSPTLMGRIFQALGAGGVEILALANSHSAISVVLHEESLDPSVAILFESFRFRTYQSPSEWRRAQNGKEILYKEVVASYQEKKPKVYALEWQGGQQYVHLRFPQEEFAPLGEALSATGEQGMRVGFFTACPGLHQREVDYFFCLPVSETGPAENLQSFLNKRSLEPPVSVASLSMNGPHFGDRYGIASDLLQAFRVAGVEVCGLSCSVASITAVVPEQQTHFAIEAIQNCFEVPSVIERT